MRWAEHVAPIGEIRNAYKIMVGKPEGKSSLRKSRRRWESNIRIGLEETECEVVNWIRLAQDTDKWRGPVNTVMNLPVP